jgi:hypothetical protein
MQQTVPGRYQHYKGGYYQVIGVAKHSETLEDLVVYIHEGKDSFGREDALWVRPLAMFMETVEKDGKTLPRFRLIEPDKATV